MAGARVPARHAVGQELFQVAVGMEAGERRFEYNDGLTPNLRTYRLNAAPLVVAQGEVYPLGGARALEPGITLGYGRAVGLRSGLSESGPLSTEWSRLYVGGKLRLRTGDEGSPIVSLTGAYGEELFAMDGSPTASLPAVDYRFVRASADARFPIGRAALFANAGYLFVLSAGDVANRFSKSNVGGVLAEIGGAFTLVTSLEARLSASYRRFFYSMQPTPGDAYVAGGALDELAGVQASLAYVY
jgi:hypothetical protein